MRRASYFAFHVVGLAVGLALCSSSAWAKAGASPVVRSGAAGGSVSYGGGLPADFQRQITTAPGSAAQIIDNLRLGLPGGAVAEASVIRTVSKAALTAAVGIALGGAVGAVATAALPVLWDALADRGIVPGSDGKPAVDPGQAYVMGYQYKLAYSPGYGGPGAIMAERHNTYSTSCAQNQAGYSPGASTFSVSTATGSAVATFKVKGKCAAWVDGVEVVWFEVNDQWTQAGVPAEECPQTSQTPLARRSTSAPCASDTRVAPPPGYVEQQVGQIPDTRLPDIVRELAPKVDIDTSPGTLSGPQTVSAPPRTVTKPDGTVQTQTQTHNITYSGSTYNYTTVITTNEGDQTTVETNPENKEQKTDCEKFPDTLGCMKAGDIPEVGELQELEIQEESGGNWGASDSTCPAPPQVSVLGQQITVDNSLLCQFLSGIRFAVLGACALAAALIVVGAFKGS